MSFMSRDALSPYPFDVRSPRTPRPSPVIYGTAAHSDNDMVQLRTVRSTRDVSIEVEEHDLNEITPYSAPLSRTSRAYRQEEELSNPFSIGYSIMDPFGVQPDDQLFTFARPNQNSARTQANRSIRGSQEEEWSQLASGMLNQSNEESHEMALDITENQNLFITNPSSKKEKILGWLPLRILQCDDGRFPGNHEVFNILEDNQSIYSTYKGGSVNMSLVLNSSDTVFPTPPFTLFDVTIRVPRNNSSCPVRNGFIFIYTDELPLTSFDKYDKVNTRTFLGPTDENDTIPKVPKCVQTVLFFQLDHSSASFRYKFQTPINNARFIMVKLLRPFGSRETMDLEFIGFHGRVGPLSFPSASLI